MAHVSGGSGTVWAADPATGGDFCTATAHNVGHFILLPLAICHAGHENGANVVASQKQRSAYIYMMNTSNSNSSNT